MCVELGLKDIEKGQAAPVCRDTGKKEFVERNALAQRLQNVLEVEYAAFEEID